MEPLHQALGKLRTTNSAGRSGGICSSEEELNDLIHSLKYRIQHESIPLSEEKQILREIKLLEGTREKVMANAAMRAKIQDSLGQKEAIQDQVKLMGVDLDGARKDQQAAWTRVSSLDAKIKALDKDIKTLQDEVQAVSDKRDKAFESIKELRKQRDAENALFYEYRRILNQAKDLAEREKKAKKKAGFPMNEESAEAEEIEETEKADDNVEAPVEAQIPNKPKVHKENTMKNRTRSRGADSLPKAILKRKKSTNYWLWAGPAGLALALVAALVYYFYLL
ncbi:hypothetical protein Dsin_022344 [Dipteronia sinensis]|uniref:Uncharacterized protein n=1 Tax=Dipteronia sinensis TaxID=43782 RepID=A0AAE0A2B3_9ROSI|nr:hypothetical protein Dsin_022344 [Dipteronia sinensis]